MPALTRHFLDQQARRAIFVGGEEDACFQLLRAQHVIFQRGAEVVAFQRHHALIGRLVVFARIERDDQLAGADQIRQRVRGGARRTISGAAQNRLAQFGGGAHRKIGAAFDHHQAHRRIRVFSAGLQHQRAVEFEGGREQCAGRHRLAEQGAHLERIGMALEHLTPGDVEINHRSAHIGAFEYEGHQEISHAGCFQRRKGWKMRASIIDRLVLTLHFHFPFPLGAP